MSNEDLCYGLFFTAGTADMKVVKWWRRPAAEVIRMCMVRSIPDALFVFVTLIQTDSIIQLWLMHKVWAEKQCIVKKPEQSESNALWECLLFRKHCIVGRLDQPESSVLWEIWSNQKAMHYRKFGVVRKQCILGKLNQSQHSVSWEIWSNQKAMPRGKTIKAISEQCIVGRLINFLQSLLILMVYSS